MTVDLPDVPEAAVEAGANALVLFFDVGDATGLHGARLVLAAALPVLVEQGWTPPEVTKQLIRERDQAQASERLGNAALERLINALDHAKAQNWICTYGNCHAPAVTGEGVDARCEEHRDVEQGWTPPEAEAVEWCGHCDRYITQPGHKEKRNV